MEAKKIKIEKQVDILQIFSPAVVEYWPLVDFMVREGLKYDCVKEINPLLPERPSTTRLLLHKGIIFSIPILVDNSWKDTTSQDMLVANLFTGIVVLNNLDIVSEANKSCSRL